MSCMTPGRDRSSPASHYQQLLFQGLSLVPEALPQIEGVSVHTVIGMALDTPQIADGLAVDSVFRRGLR